MMDWLAEQYVILWSKASFFIENPTSCDWIDFFQLAFVSLGGFWLLRTAFAMLRSRTLTKASLTLEDHPDEDASRKLRTAFDNARKALGAGRRGSLDPTRLRVRDSEGALLLNAGILRPEILVSTGLMRKLNVEELTAALAHEIAHVVHRDNLKRVGIELACLLLPLSIWVHDGLRLAVSPRAEFLTALVAGIAAWVGVRAVVVPAIRYAQERRADERAAETVGDRLTVAAALVSTASASSRTDRRLVPFPSTSFAFYNAPISSRVRRLVELERAPGWIRLQRSLGGVVRAAAASFVLVAALAVHRAESQGLAGVVRISSCAVTLHVERATSPMATACAKSPAS